MDKLQEYEQAKDQINYHFPVDMYGTDAQREFLIAYLMGMGWCFDDACEAVFDGLVPASIH